MYRFLRGKELKWMEGPENIFFLIDGDGQRVILWGPSAPEIVISQYLLAVRILCKKKKEV